MADSGSQQWPPRPTNEKALDDEIVASLARYLWLKPAARAARAAAVANLCFQVCISIVGIVSIYKAAAGLLAMMLEMLQIVAFLFVIVLYLTWLTRSAKNIVALTRRKSALGGAFLVLAHVLPVVNLYRPWRIVRQIWEAIPNNALYSRGVALINGWWALWIVCNIISIALSAVYYQNPTDYRSILITQIFDTCACALVTVLFIRMVGLISDAEDGLAEEMGILQRRPS